MPRARLEAGHITSPAESETQLEKDGLESTAAAKLTDPNCIDPDLSQVSNQASLMLCDGTIAVGYLKLPVDCVGDGVAGCVTTPSFISADKNSVAPTDLRSGRVLAGIVGTLSDLPDCASDGSIGCISVPGFKAADMTNVTAGNIKSGTTIAGVAGDYPSATYPLPGATATADLTNFITQLTTAGSFEFWDSTGTRRTGSGDVDIVVGNIASGVAFENLSLTGISGPNCTADGQQGCLTTSRYKAMDTDSSVISTWDIRKGKTTGGIAGDLVFYKNMVDTATFNRTSGTAALAGVDPYDTIEDYNNGGAFPTMAPAGWDQATGANWLRDSTSDNGAGGGTAADGICNGTEGCVYKDRTSGSYWAKDDGTTRTWETAITYCDALSYGGYTDWRLPTQKELMQASADGAWSQKASTKLNLSTADYWSSSTLSGSTTFAWFVFLGNGDPDVNPKTNVYQVLCVR